MLPIATGVTNNTDVGANLAGTSAITLTGLSSGSSATIAKGSTAGAVHQLYESRPTIKVASTSPSGALTPSTAQLLAIFDVTATETEDITFNTSDQIVIQISTSWQTSDGVAGVWSLKDGDGVLLDTTNVTEGSGANTTVTFGFTDSTFTIPAGETKQLKVYGDTHEYTDGTTWTDQIQLWLDDAADANCTFGIDGTGGNAEGKIIFKGDIYAGNFVMP